MDEEFSVTGGWNTEGRDGGALGGLDLLLRKSGRNVAVVERGQGGGFVWIAAWLVGDVGSGR